VCVTGVCAGDEVAGHKGATLGTYLLAPKIIIQRPAVCVRVRVSRSGSLATALFVVLASCPATPSYLHAVHRLGSCSLTPARIQH
jgi:hypothetical protein